MSLPHFTGHDGVCPKLEDVIGDIEGGRRWATFLTRGSRTSVDFQHSWSRVHGEAVQYAEYLDVALESPLSAEVEILETGWLGIRRLESIANFPGAVWVWDKSFLSSRFYLGHPLMYLVGRRVVFYHMVQLQIRLVVQILSFFSHWIVTEFHLYGAFSEGQEVSSLNTTRDTRGQFLVKVVLWFKG